MPRSGGADLADLPPSPGAGALGQRATADLTELADLLAGRPVATEATTILLAARLGERKATLDPSKLLAPADVLLRRGDHPAGALAVAVIGTAGARAGWPDGWRQLLRAARAHPEIEVRQAALALVTDHESRTAWDDELWHLSGRCAAGLPAVAHRTSQGPWVLVLWGGVGWCRPATCARGPWRGVEDRRWPDRGGWWEAALVPSSVSLRQVR